MLILFALLFPTRLRSYVALALLRPSLPKLTNITYRLPPLVNDVVTESTQKGKERVTDVAMRAIGLFSNVRQNHVIEKADKIR